MIGDVFVTTFDGRIFLQPGACQYVLAKSRSGSRFTVTLQYTTCAEVARMTPNERTHTWSPTLVTSVWLDVTSFDVRPVSTAPGVHSVGDGGVG